MSDPVPVLVSLIIPVFNEDAGLAENLLYLLGEAATPGIEFEALVVDDGSTDGTVSVLTRLAAADARIRPLFFTRNFGKEAAILAGLSHAKGAAAVVIDSDRQHPPQMIPAMIDHWRRGFAVVEAVKCHRGEADIGGGLPARLFYWLFRRASGFDLAGQTDFKLIDRAVVDVLINLPEKKAVFPRTAGLDGVPQRPLAFRCTTARRWRDPLADKAPGEIRHRRADGIFRVATSPDRTGRRPRFRGGRDRRGRDALPEIRGHGDRRFHDGHYPRGPSERRTDGRARRCRVVPGANSRTAAGQAVLFVPFRTERGSKMNAWGIAIVAVVFNVAAQLAIKLAGGNFNPLPLAAALLCYGLSFFLTFKIYAVNPLSLAAPLMAGLTFLLTPLAAVLLLGESLGTARVLGIALILAGIVIISRFP